MNGEKLHDAIGRIDDDLIAAVGVLRERGSAGRKIPWMRYASLAACVCVLAGGILVFDRMYHGMSGRAETETMAGVTTEGAPEAGIEEAVGEAEGVQETMAVPETESYGGNEEFVYTPQVSIRWLENIGDCIKNADSVLICTVQEVGEAFAEEDPSIIGIPGGSGEHDYVRSIRTPLTLSVQEILYDRTGTVGDTIEVLEYYGTVGKYTLEGIFPIQYEEGHTYLLYLAERPDGKANCILEQGSAELFREETAAEGLPPYSHFRPLVNETIYRDCPDVESLIEAVRSAAGEMDNE